MISKDVRARSKKILASAQGQDCQIRSPVCSYNNEQTVCAHLGGGGMSRKVSDIFVAYACYECHTLCDTKSDPATKLMFYDGMVRTQVILLRDGLIIIK